MKRVLLLACSVAAEMRPRSRSLRARPLAPRPAVEVDEFEQRRRLACVNVDTTQDSYGDTCSTYYDHNPGGCGTGDCETDNAVAGCEKPVLLPRGVAVNCLRTLSIC